MFAGFTLRGPWHPGGGPGDCASSNCQLQSIKRKATWIGREIKFVGALLLLLRSCYIRPCQQDAADVGKTSRYLFL